MVLGYHITDDVHSLDSTVIAIGSMSKPLQSESKLNEG